MSEKLVAIVTGASRGIGKAVAQELSSQGYQLVVNYFDFKDGKPDDTTAQQTQQEIINAGGVCEILRGDISSSQDRQALVDLVKQKFGRCDLLVNNAGVAPTKRIDILDATEESYDRVMNMSG